MPATAPTVTAALAKDKASQPILAIHFTAKTVTETGVFLPRADATPSPTLSVQSSAVRAPDSKYIAIALDPDAPFPSLPILGPIVHGIQTDLIATGEPDTEGWIKLEASPKPVIAWAPPRPPPTSGPHRYVFLLYVQSEGSDAEGTKKKLALPETIGVMQRARWDQGACEKKLGLGEVVASNYFRSK